MEEAKDIRELKSLLSDLSPNDDARHFPVGIEGKATDVYANKIALFKKLSVLLFSLSLFLFLSLLLCWSVVISPLLHTTIPSKQ